MIHYTGRPKTGKPFSVKDQIQNTSGQAIAGLCHLYTLPLWSKSGDGGPNEALPTKVGSGYTGQCANFSSRWKAQVTVTDESLCGSSDECCSHPTETCHITENPNTRTQLVMEGQTVPGPRGRAECHIAHWPLCNQQGFHYAGLWLPRQERERHYPSTRIQW